MSKEIILANGLVSTVDDQDYPYLSQFRWYPTQFGYAARVFGPKKKRIWMRMHREILNAPIGTQVDHIDGNKLNNTRSNLRFATASQNHQNRKTSRSNTSGYKGVCKNHKAKRSERWRASIVVNHVVINLGTYPTAEKAAHAYDDAAKKCHKEFANLNFPNEGN